MKYYINTDTKQLVFSNDKPLQAKSLNNFYAGDITPVEFYFVNNNKEYVNIGSDTVKVALGAPRKNAYSGHWTMVYESVSASFSYSASAQQIIDGFPIALEVHGRDGAYTVSFVDSASATGSFSVDKTNLQPSCVGYVAQIDTGSYAIRLSPKPYGYLEVSPNILSASVFVGASGSFNLKTAEAVDAVGVQSVPAMFEIQVGEITYLQAETQLKNDIIGDHLNDFEGVDLPNFVTLEVLNSVSASLASDKLSKSTFDSLSGSFVQTSSFNSFSGSVSTRLTNEENSTVTLLAASASLQRYNADSGSFLSEISTKLSTSVYLADSASFNSGINSKLSTSVYSIDSASVSTRFTNLDLTSASVSTRLTNEEATSSLLSTQKVNTSDIYVTGSGAINIFATKNVAGSASPNARGTGSVDLQQFRISPSNVASGTYSAIGGGTMNSAGGARSTVAGGSNNSASGNYSNICGGSSNTAGGLAAFVGGGSSNNASGTLYSAVAGGIGNNASGDVSFVGGGESNTASGYRGVVAGGVNNMATGQASTVAGGNTNRANGNNSTVAGGQNNTVGGSHSAIGGGLGNRITTTAAESGIFCGNGNQVSGSDAFIGGGQNNRASSSFSVVAGGEGNIALSAHSFVGGGRLNTTSTNIYATVGGGYSNLATGQSSTVAGGYNNEASGNRSFVGGGRNNTATDQFCTVGGGTGNTASNYATTIGGGRNNTTNNSRATIAGGNNNTASGGYSFVGGGKDNQSTASQATVCGGEGNKAQGTCSTVGGGQANTASGIYSTITGGRWAAADRYGMEAHANGYFVSFGDAQRTSFILRNTTSDATPTQLFLDGSSTRLTVSSNKMFGFIINITGVRTGGTDCSMYIRQGLIRNTSGTTSLVGTINTIGVDIESNASTDVSITASDANDALIITVTGITGQTWRWVAHVQAVEIGF